MTEGRAAAEQVRENARQALERARAEIAQLQTRRDTIAAELGQLSGVIEALSVPEREQLASGATPTPSTPTAPVPAPTPAPAEPAPTAQETPDA